MSDSTAISRTFTVRRHQFTAITITELRWHVRPTHLVRQYPQQAPHALSFKNVGMLVYQGLLVDEYDETRPGNMQSGGCLLAYETCTRVQTSFRADDRFSAAKLQPPTGLS